MLRLLFPLALSLCTYSSLTFAQNTDTILHNARIYTVNEDMPWASSVAIEDGKLTYVGDDEGAKAFQGVTTRVVDMQGQFMLPGFQDAHAHPIFGVAYTSGCPIFELGSVAAITAEIKRCVAENPDAPHIVGAGWAWDDFPADQPPNRTMLDAIDSTRPLVFADADGHTQWLNSAALKLAGVNADTADPEGGMIGRDEASGEANGLLMENSGMELIVNKLPLPTPEQKRVGLEYAQDYFHSLGITAVQEALVSVSAPGLYDSLPTYEAWNNEGGLKLRVMLALHWESERGMAQIDDMLAARKKYSKGRLQAGQVKFWSDGILESYTAMMLEPYSDKPETLGLMMVPPEQMMEAGPILDKAGFALHIHTIGDAAARYALDAIEASQKANGKRDSRHQLVHVQMLNPDDVPRFAELGAIANFQPLWAYGDGYVIDINTPQMGPERMKQMYPIGAVANSGGRVAFGSDWSVSSANPFPAMEIAITRQDPETSTTPVFNPEQRISLEQAIAGYTIDAAFANLIDDTTGSVEVGKYADLIVVDRNLFEIPVGEISEASVSATLFEGEEVYGSLGE
ncbi:MAG: amidohydrolase [Halioglobus sp.]